jgi:hypothetical protein
MKRNHASLVELALADGQDPLVEIRILPIQVERFTNAEPRHRQQSEETVVVQGRRPPAGESAFAAPSSLWI